MELKKLMENYSLQTGRDLRVIKFLFEGQFLLQTDTADSVSKMKY